MSLTIDCGEGRHWPICTGTGTEHYSPLSSLSSPSPQQDDGTEFECACGCHQTDPPGQIRGPEEPPYIAGRDEVPQDVPDDNYLGGYLEDPGENVTWVDGEGMEGPQSTDGTL